MRRQLADRVRGQEAAGVLQVQAIHLGAAGQRGRVLGVIGVRVHVADRVREPDHDLLEALGAGDRGQPSQTSGVVGRVGDLQPPQAVANRKCIRQPHHVLGGRHPRDEPHAGRDHPQRRRRHRLADEPDPLPWILAMEADRDRHVRARGEVERVVADPIERRRDRQHVGRRQAGRAPQALVAVTHARVDELDHTTAHVGLPFTTGPPGTGRRPPRPRPRSPRRRRRPCR